MAQTVTIPSRVASLRVIALLAHPDEEHAQERFVAAMRSMRIREDRVLTGRNPPPDLCRIRDALSSRDAYRAMQRGFRLIETRRFAFRVLRNADLQREPLYGRDPRRAQRLRLGTHDPDAEPYFTWAPESLNGVLRWMGSDASNVRRDAWRPSLPVLPIAAWLESRIDFPPAEGAAERKQLPMAAMGRSRHPDLFKLAWDNSWVPDCVGFTQKFIADWPSRQERAPALRNIGSECFIRLRA